MCLNLYLDSQVSKSVIYDIDFIKTIFQKLDHLYSWYPFFKLLEPGKMSISCHGFGKLYFYSMVMFTVWLCHSYTQHFSRPVPQCYHFTGALKTTFNSWDIQRDFCTRQNHVQTNISIRYFDKFFPIIPVVTPWLENRKNRKQVPPLLKN